MSLRTRLFCTYTGLVLAALLLFGALTQHQASAMADQREVELLRSHAGYLARQFAQLLQEGIPASVALANLREYSDRDWILQVQSVGSITLSRKPDGITLPLDLPQLTDPYTRSGHSVQGGRSYAWATVESPGTAYHLRLLRASTREDPMLAKGLLTRLAFAGGLVLLLISGAALLLSQRIARGFRAETAALTHRALHDSLTGLPNRTLLFDRLAHTLGEAHRHGNPVGLFILDLDRFKEVNDTLGHHSGDLLLKTVGERVNGLLRRSDTIARLGGDEFAILLPHTPLSRAQRCAEKIIDCLETPIPTAGVDLDIDVSIGIAMYPDHGTDAETLLQHADVAMYKAKEHNLGYAIYEPREDRHSVRRLTLMAELRAAIEKHQLELHYQPKLNLKTRQVEGVEALLRWQHPEYGYVTPDEFIPLTEQSGLIFPLTDWVLREALRQRELWHKQGLHLHVAVNLSTCSLQDAQCASKIAKLLSHRLVVADQLVLEITESAMMTDVNRAMDVVSALDAIGVRLSIDDFGTGFSSLSHLKRLPVDELKIDRSFVQDMERDESDAILIQSIIDLAHNMGLRVVAEGVESAGALEMLEQLGCDMAQGFHISRPLPAREFEAWLAHSPWRGDAQADDLDPELVLAT
ncbi:MAG: EAL domain-containing protein [Xanthomonadaceae bacterium]|nr:EAL domain-containing protein [Xanthomonadaceae bacterium]